MAVLGRCPARLRGPYGAVDQQPAEPRCAALARPYRRGHCGVLSRTVTLTTPRPCARSHRPVGFGVRPPGTAVAVRAAAQELRQASGSLPSTVGAPAAVCPRCYRGQLGGDGVFRQAVRGVGSCPGAVSSCTQRYAGLTPCGEQPAHRASSLSARCARMLARARQISLADGNCHKRGCKSTRSPYRLWPRCARCGLLSLVHVRASERGGGRATHRPLSLSLTLSHTQGVTRAGGEEHATRTAGPTLPEGVRQTADGVLVQAGR